MLAKEDRCWAGDAGHLEALEVPHLLFGPDLHHLARIMLGIPVSEPELPGNVAITVLEDQNGGFVDLDGTIFPTICFGVVNIGLFASANAAVDLVDVILGNHFEEDHSGPGVQHLLHRRSV